MIDLFDTVALPTQVQFEELIDLSQIVSLKIFTLTLTDAKEANYVPWLSRIFSSASSNQQLEEICLKVICSGRSSNDTWWHGAFDALLQGQFKRLERLKIFLNVALRGGGSAYGRDLNSHEDIERLRSQRGMSVDVMCKYNLFFVILSLLTIVLVCHDFDMIRFEQDVRWATHEWGLWTPVDVESLKISDGA